MPTSPSVPPGWLALRPESGYTRQCMIDSRGLGDGSFKFNSKVARPGNAGTATTTADAKPAGVGEHRQDQQQSLTIGRQLVGGWSSIVDGDGPPKSAPPPQEEATPQDLSRSPQARLSGSDNAQVTRVQVQVFSKPENESRMQEGPSEGQRETEAQTKTKIGRTSCRERV